MPKIDTSPRSGRWPRRYGRLAMSVDDRAGGRSDERSMGHSHERSGGHSDDGSGGR
jgi:hypothetical protein